MPKDLKVTDSGDLVVGPNGDFLTVEGDEYLCQTAMFRLKTFKGDYTLVPELGTSLEDFIGQENTFEVRERIAQSVIDSLTFDNLISNPSVKCVSVGENEVFILVEFAATDPDKKIQLSGFLDLKQGEVFNRLEVSIQ